MHSTAAGRLACIRIVLCETSHPGNIGAAARAMQTMGLSRLTLVRPRRFPDPEAQARAAGAAEVLAAARVVDTLEEALGESRLAVALTARPRELATAAAPLREAAAAALGPDAAGEAAFVFGNETSGLSNEQVARCQMLCHIPAEPSAASLNLAAAVQVVAYELRMAALAQQGRVENAPPSPRLAPLADVEHLYAHAARTLVALGFLDPRRPRRLMPRLRRLFARTRLEREEVDILRGILAAVDRLTGPPGER